MYLADRDIRDLLPEMKLRGPNDAHPFNSNTQIQPCSIDLSVSNVFWKPRRRRRFWRRLLPGFEFAIHLGRSGIPELGPLRDWTREELQEGEVITIKPGEVVMSRIYERFRIPAKYAGKIEGRSSFARLGLSIHCTGDFINPGWEGFMPLQLYNAGPYPLKLPPYLSICQLVLIQLSSDPERPYGHAQLDSKYVNDDGGPSLWWRDARVKEIQRRLGEVSVTERISQEVVTILRPEQSDVLERFQRFLDHQKVGSVDNADQLLDAFAKNEDRRRLVDRVARASPAVLLGGVIGLLTGSHGALLVFLISLTILGLVASVWAYGRSVGGYLGRKELEEAKHRPKEASS